MGEAVLDDADEFLCDEAAALLAVPPRVDFAAGVGTAEPVDVDHHVGEGLELISQ